MGYEFLDHTADIKVRASGPTIETAFESAAMGLKESVCGALDVAPRHERRVAVEGADHESLLCNFLEEFLYLLDSDDFLLSGVASIEIAGMRLSATVTGDAGSSYDFSNGVKAVTYSEVSVREEDGVWVAEVVLDV